MAGRAFARLALLLAVAAIVAACFGSSKSASPLASSVTSPATSAASSSESAAPPSEEPSVPAEPTTLEQIVYFLEGDSTGTKPNPGTTILLLFEPGGRAVLYATSESDKLGHHGTWRYEGGQLSLKFTAEDFKPDATFGLDLAATTVTMPFLVFDTGQGTSTWKRGSLSLVTKTNIVFRAEAVDPDSTLTPDQAVDEALAVAQGIAASNDPNVDVFPLASNEPPATLMALIKRRASDTPRADDPQPPDIKSVTKLYNGLHVEYEDGPALDVLLFDTVDPPTSYASLVPGPIASDPRVRLDPEPSGYADDPANRKAVLIAPFSSRRAPGGTWTKITRDGVLAFIRGTTGAYYAHPTFDWNRDAGKLRQHGYAVDTAVDSDATLLRIFELLGGRSKSAPGLVIVMTHGLSNGDLLTGLDLGSSKDEEAVDRNFAAALREIEAFAPDFATFEGGTEAVPETVGRVYMAYENEDKGGEIFLTLTPSFWRWLKSHGVSFGKSLVYVGACLSDATPDLREAISARAYFAWTQPVYELLDGAVANYLVDSMLRPTHTAEDVYYNVVRIVSTGQRIYDEDQDLDKVFGLDIPRGSAFLDYFRGYGFDGHNLVPYATNGWFDMTMNPGHVWWLVFAGRWDKKARDGAAALVECETTYWQKSQQGGLRDQFCNAAAPGGTPTPDEVAYATYVLTGERLLPFGGTAVPRMTLRDGEP